jgi:hypothetical protein
MPLARKLGPLDATMIVVSGIIGSGIFINPYHDLPGCGWARACAMQGPPPPLRFLALQAEAVRTQTFLGSTFRFFLIAPIPP